MKMPSSRRLAIFFTVTLSVVGLDQLTKYSVVDALTRRLEGRDTSLERLKAFYSTDPEGIFGYHFSPKRSIAVSENFFHIRYAENPGAAWSLFRNLPENIRRPFFHLISILAVAFISYAFWQLKGSADEVWAVWGYPLVLGGALGNYVDRVARSFVIDFLEVHWYNGPTWPSFNIADSAICVGVGLLLIDAFLRREKVKVAR